MLQFCVPRRDAEGSRHVDFPTGQCLCKTIRGWEVWESTRNGARNGEPVRCHQAVQFIHNYPHIYLIRPTGPHFSTVSGVQFFHVLPVNRFTCRVAVSRPSGPSSGASLHWQRNASENVCKKIRVWELEGVKVRDHPKLGHVQWSKCSKVTDKTPSQQPATVPGILALSFWDLVLSYSFLGRSRSFQISHRTFEDPSWLASSGTTLLAPKNENL